MKRRYLHFGLLIAAGTILTAGCTAAADSVPEDLWKSGSNYCLSTADLKEMNTDELQMAIQKLFAELHRKITEESRQESSISGSVMHATATVNIRSTASTSGTVLGVVPQGYTVTATGTANGGWIPVSYNGIRGYISQDYLKSGRGSNADSGSSENNTEAISGNESNAGSAGNEAEQNDIYTPTYQTICGTILDRGATYLELDADGAVYNFALGGESPVYGEIGDYISLNYTGDLNGSPVTCGGIPIASETALENGLQTMQGTLLVEGQALIRIQTEDGTVYDFTDFSGSRPNGMQEGDSITIQYYGEPGSGAQVTAIIAN